MTYDRMGVDISGVIGKNENDAFTFVNSNAESFQSVSFFVNAPTGGEVVFEQTFDNINWETLTLRSVDNDIYCTGTDNGSSFLGSIAAVKKFRIRTSSAGSAPGSIVGRVIKGLTILEGIEFGYPPHKIGYPPFHIDKNYSIAKTNEVLYTPPTGKKFAVTDYGIIVSGTTDGIATIFDETNEEGKRLFNGNIEVVTNKQFSRNHSFRVPFQALAIDNSLKLTTSTAIAIDIMIHGYYF